MNLVGNNKTILEKINNNKKHGMRFNNSKTKFKHAKTTNTLDALMKKYKFSRNK